MKRKETRNCRELQQKLSLDCKIRLLPCVLHIRFVFHGPLVCLIMPYLQPRVQEKQIGEVSLNLSQKRVIAYFSPTLGTAALAFWHCGPSFLFTLFYETGCCGATLRVRKNNPQKELTKKMKEENKSCRKNYKKF